MKKGIEGGNVPQEEKFSFDSITWPEGNDIPLADKELWEKNKNVIRMLFAVGKPASSIEGVKGKDTYTKMPKNYEVDGIEVEFLPNWGFYRVGGISLNIPESQEDIKKDVEAAKYLSSRGFESKK